MQATAKAFTYTQYKPHPQGLYQRSGPQLPTEPAESAPIKRAGAEGGEAGPMQVTGKLKGLNGKVIFSNSINFE